MTPAFPLKDRIYHPATYRNQLVRKGTCSSIGLFRVAYARRYAHGIELQQGAPCRTKLSFHACSVLRHAYMRMDEGARSSV